MNPATCADFTIDVHTLAHETSAAIAERLGGGWVLLLNRVVDVSVVPCPAPVAWPHVRRLFGSSCWRSRASPSEMLRSSSGGRPCCQGSSRRSCGASCRTAWHSRSWARPCWEWMGTLIEVRRAHPGTLWRSPFARPG